MPRFAPLVLAFACFAASAKPVPEPPPLDAEAYVLMDGATGQILSAKNPDKKRSPASITKVMTSYVAFEEIAAFAGVGSDDPAFAALESGGDTLRPLTPVHCAVSQSDTGDHQWSWVRRARGMWRWLDGVDLPLVEEREEYRVGFGPADSPDAQWQVSEPCLALPPATWSDLVAQYPEAQLWVRQIGTHAVSLPVALPHPS